jgi:hypothetical protein
MIMRPLGLVAAEAAAPHFVFYESYRADGGASSKMRREPLQ